jgi:hypothetical protein
MGGEVEAEPQEVSEEELSSSVERNRSQILLSFSNSVGTFNQRALEQYNAALENFETTIQSASVQETRADILGVIAKTALEEGFKEVSKQVLGAAAPIAGAVLALAKNIKQETDRAAAASVNRSAGDWIKQMRRGVNDAFAKHGTSDVVLRGVTSAYANASEDERQVLVDEASFAAAAIEEGTWAVADVAVYERSLYEGWINGHFSAIGRVDDDISGFVDVRFEDGDMPSAAAVVAPLGDRIGDALNTIAGSSGLSSMMELKVHKRVCKWADNAVGGSGWSCGWFDDRNVMISEPNSEVVTEFLQREDWRSTVTLFR